MMPLKEAAAALLLMGTALDPAAPATLEQVASEQMRPGFEGDDAMDRGATHAHDLCQHRDGIPIVTTPTHIKHLVVAEFSLMMSFPPVFSDALIASAFSPHIPVVIASRSEKQMIRSHTGWRIAMVQNTCSGRDRAPRHQPRNPVSQHGSPATPLIDLSITLGPSISDPQPACPRFINQSPEAFGKRLSTFTAFESLPKSQGSGVGPTAARIATKLSVRRFVLTAFGASASLGHGLYI